jgi:membrane-associated phospholipid phosphatase
LGKATVGNAVIGRPSTGVPTRQLLVWMVATLIAAALASFTVARNAAPIWGDIEITRRVQATPLVVEIAVVVNPIGGSAQWFYGAAVVVLLITGRRIGGGLSGPRLRREALWAAFAAAILRPSSGFLKELIGSPRPSEAFGVRIHDASGGFGFPSGHVFGDVLVLGVLAVYARAFLSPRLVEPFRVLITVLIVLAGPSRVSVGAHWPSDVAGGYLWGVCALLIALTVGRTFGRQKWIRQNSNGVEIVVDGGPGAPTQRETSAAEN